MTYYNFSISHPESDISQLRSALLGISYCLRKWIDKEYKRSHTGYSLEDPMGSVKVEIDGERCELTLSFCGPRDEADEFVTAVMQFFDGSNLKYTLYGSDEEGGRNFLKMCFKKSTLSQQH